MRKVGEVAYELELPEGGRIHNVFHVSCLKKVVGQFINTSEELPPLDKEGQLEFVPEEVLEFRERKLKSRVIRECLIRWRGIPVEDATYVADRQLIEHSFEVGDVVFVRLQPYRQSSLKKSEAEKLKPRFYGPYRIMCRVGEVAYELELPEGSWIHNVLHLSCLKKVVGQFISTSKELPPLDEEGQLELVLEEVLEFREWKLRSRVMRECLIRWRGLPVEDASWESEQVLQHPGLVLLEDKQSREGRTVMSLSE
jgi:hypothetical protein